MKKLTLFTALVLIFASATAYAVYKILRYSNTCGNTRSTSKCVQPVTCKQMSLTPMPIIPSTNYIGRDYQLV